MRAIEMVVCAWLEKVRFSLVGGNGEVCGRGGGRQRAMRSRLVA